jgi:ABC-type amino acid transport substrate-binding protein
VIDKAVTYDPALATRLAAELLDRDEGRPSNTDRSASEQLLAAVAEIERLHKRVLVPLTEQQVVAALHEGRAEAMAATGDNAWASLLIQRDAARIEAIRAQAERDSFHASLDICHDECKTLRDELTATEDRCDAIEVEVERLRPVFETAKTWSATVDYHWRDRDEVTGQPGARAERALLEAVDVALAKEPRK